jgi:hypothetical protein
VAASDDNELAALTFGDGRQVAVAVHGITASAMAWRVVAASCRGSGRLWRPTYGGAGERRHTGPLVGPS